MVSRRPGNLKYSVIAREHPVKPYRGLRFRPAAEHAAPDAYASTVAGPSIDHEGAIGGQKILEVFLAERRIDIGDRGCGRLGADRLRRQGVAQERLGAGIHRELAIGAMNGEAEIGGEEEAETRVMRLKESAYIFGIGRHPPDRALAPEPAEAFR